MKFFKGSLYSAFLFPLVIFISSCTNWLNPPNKFYSASIDDVKEGGPMAPAQIRFSHPKIFSQGILQNYRMEEERHLKALLAASPSENFGPQFRHILI